MDEDILTKLLARPGKPLKKYKVLICRHCHKAQMTSAEKALKCIACGKSNRFFSDNGHLSQYFYMTDSPQDAAKAVIRVSEAIEEVRRGFGSNCLQKAFNDLNKLK
jgi:hypothetical protein